MSALANLPARGVVLVEGDDRVAFLQGLVSNDVAQAQPGRAVWAALLTPQGKWLADFFIFSDNERLLLDCESAQVPAVVQRLSRYRLRMNVALRPVPEWHVFVAWPDRPAVDDIGDQLVAAPDPRLPEFAWRLLTPASLPANATAEDWDRHRLEAGLPEASLDMEADRSILLEAGFDELNGVSWTKGCYMGQELTARTKYRGLVKRRLVPVSIDGSVPPSGTVVTRNGVDVGTMRSSRGDAGLAVLRLDVLGAGELRCGEATVQPRVPGWMRLPAPAVGS